MGSRLRFVARRIVIGLIQLIGLVLAVFFLIRLMPADPAARLVGMSGFTRRLSPRRVILWAWTGRF